MTGLSSRSYDPAGEAFRFFPILGVNGFEIGKDETSELRPREIDFHPLDDILVNRPYIKAGIGHEVRKKSGIHIQETLKAMGSIPGTETRERSFLHFLPELTEELIMHHPDPLDSF